MYKIRSEKYEISIKSIEEKEFNIENYDYIFNPDDIIYEEDFFGGIELNIKDYKNQSTKKYAIYELYYIEDEKRVIIKDDDLIILLSESINKISLIDNELKYHMELNDYGTSWEIFDVGIGYVIHHETAVIMLNKDLSIKWEADMPDVTTTPTAKCKDEAFKIEDNTIVVKCFDGTIFSIDFDGNVTQID